MPASVGGSVRVCDLGARRVAVVGEHGRVSARAWLVRVVIAVAVLAAFSWLMTDVLLLGMPLGLFL